MASGCTTIQVTPSSQAARREAAYFDATIDEQADFNPFSDRGWQRLEQCFARHCKGRGQLDILEVGCGTGHSRRIYQSQARRFVGIDLSRRSLSLAHGRHPQHPWICADAGQLPFAQGSFDAVVFSSVLHHLPEMTRSLQDAYRVLRPGGLAFAFDPNVWHPAMALFRSPRSPLYCPKGVSPNERPLAASELRAAFSQAGFRSIQIRAQSDISYSKVAPRGLNRCLKLFELADRLWDRSGMGRWFGTFLITCARRPIPETAVTCC